MNLAAARLSSHLDAQLDCGTRNNFIRAVVSVFVNKALGHIRAFNHTGMSVLLSRLGVFRSYL